MRLSRRKFLGATASAVLVAGTRAKGRVFGANDKAGIACVGINGRGKSHIEAYAKSNRAYLAALCDVDKRVLADRSRVVAGWQMDEPKGYADIREMLEDPAVDAITVATPNHWHSLATIWAVQAGKHVYVEKPLSHNVWEGRQAVEAARKHGKVVMHGTQARSSADWIRRMRRLKEGIIGEVYMARALCFKNRDSIGYAPPSDPPGYLDWNIWQGPAQTRQYCDNYHPYNWHWFWDYGNGDIGNQGVHQMDIAIWGMGKGLPVKVSSMGGRYTYDDQGETPNTQVANFTYKDGTMLVFEVRGRVTNYEQGTGVGNLFYGSEGYFAQGGQEPFKESGFFNKSHDRIDYEKEAVETKGCWENFLDAIISGKQEDNFTPPLDAHIGCAHIHLANIAYRLGRTLEFDPDAERFVNDEEANSMLSRDYRPEFAVPQIV